MKRNAEGAFLKSVAHKLSERYLLQDKSVSEGKSDVGVAAVLPPAVQDRRVPVLAEVGVVKLLQLPRGCRAFVPVQIHRCCELTSETVFSIYLCRPNACVHT